LKKIILSVAVVFALCIGASAFSDIPDAEQNRAASSLSSLGIVEGTSAGRFSPDAFLTRAQFCKMAVLSINDNDYLTYKNYTLFPDVAYSHWASAFINCAVKKHAVLRGFPDGTFRPDGQLTYAQAITIMLNMLGYTPEDIGSLWPQDYIAKAGELGLTKGAASLSADASVPRGQVAILLRNMLLATAKEGGSLLKNSFSSVTEDVILLGTPQNDPSISEGYARFYIDGEKVLKRTERDLPSPLIGTSGYLVDDIDNSNLVVGYLSDSKKTARATVSRSYPDKLETSDGNFEIPSDAKVITSGDISDYSAAWFDLSSGVPVNLFYDSNGKISLISVESTAVSGSTFVYGISAATTLPQSAKVVKNGLPAKVADVKKYDVVTYDPASGTHYVSDRKLCGVYQEASPSFSYPTSVKVLGKTFPVSKSAAGYFKEFNYNDSITLLFDANMNVAAAYPTSAVQATQIGILDSLDESTAKITLLSGFHIEAPVNFSAYGNIIFNGAPISNLYKLEGKLVNVRQEQSGKLYLSQAASRTSADGDWDIHAGKIGTTDVLAGVRVFEQVDPSAPIVEISATDIPLSIVDEKRIAQTFLDYAGRISVIVLSDVSGSGYEYGILSGDEIKVPDESDSDSDSEKVAYYTIHLLQSDGTVLSYYSGTASGISNGPGAVAKGMENMQYYTRLPYKPLVSLGTVSLDKFDGSKGVTVSDGYVPILDDVQVYAAGVKRFLTLSEAKANFKNFQIYSDYEVEDGGRVRMILVS